MVDINLHFLRPLLCSNERRLSLLAELDLQSTLPKELFEAPKIAGTEPFMAIGVLSGKEPSYMHDLESCFLGPVLGLYALERAPQYTPACHVNPKPPPV